MPDDAGVVEWDLGMLQQGAGGTRQLMVQVGNAMSGDLIVGGSDIADASTPPNRTRATTVTRVAPSGPLQLAIAISPNPAAPSASFNVGLTVTNTGTVSVFDVVVELILPDGIGAFSPSVNSNGGTCPNTVSNQFLCEARERVVWQVGMLSAGGFAMVSTVPPIPAATRLGTVMTFDASARSSSAPSVRAEAVVRVGS